VQYEVPLDQVDAAVSQISKVLFFPNNTPIQKNFTRQGFYFNIGIPNYQGVWPEEYGKGRRPTALWHCHQSEHHMNTYMQT
jgi:hypothetical protein